jgi:hypothetical protein
MCHPLPSIGPGNANNLDGMTGTYGSNPARFSQQGGMLARAEIFALPFAAHFAPLNAERQQLDWTSAG